MSWLSALFENPITPTDRAGLFEVMTQFLHAALEVIPEPGFLWLHVLFFQMILRRSKHHGTHNEMTEINTVCIPCPFPLPPAIQVVEQHQPRV